MKKNSFLKGTAIYTASNMIIKLGGLIFLPIMTRILSTKEYGLIGLLAPITSILTTIIGLGLYNAVLKKYVDLKDDNENLKSYKFSIFMFVLCLDIVVILIFLLPISKSLIEKLFKIDYVLILISLLIALVNTFNNISLSILRLEKKYYKVAFASLISFFTNYILAIYFISKLNLGVIGNQLANLVAVSILLIFLYLDYFRNISFKFNKKYVSATIISGIPLIFIELTDQLVSFSDRFILSMYNVSLAAIGVYTLAYMGFKILAIITNSFVNAFIPELYENMGDEEVNNKLENYIMILSILCLLASLYSNEAISLIFPKNYQNAISYILVVLASSILQAFYAMDFFFHYYEKSKYIISFTLMALASNVILNIIFIPMFIENAVLVAALTTLFSMALRAVIELIVIKKKFNISFHYKKLFTYFILVCNPITYMLTVSKIGYISFIIKALYVLITIIIFDKNLFKKILRRL